MFISLFLAKAGGYPVANVRVGPPGALAHVQRAYNEL
jgi:hypothetical protein